MKNRKRDVLKYLIQKVELDKPSPDFTAVVMGEVSAQKDGVINPAVKWLLKYSGIENPPIDFAQSVITRIEALDFHTPPKPIITKKAWYLIMASVTIFILYLGFFEQASKSPGSLTQYVTNVGNILSTILANVNSVPSLYPITFISISALLVMEYFLRTRGRSHETKIDSFIP